MAGFLGEHLYLLTSCGRDLLPNPVLELTIISLFPTHEHNADTIRYKWQIVNIQGKYESAQADNH